MAEIQGLGVTHYPGIMMLDADMSIYLRRTLTSDKVPPALTDPKNWPAPMRAEWGDDQGEKAAAKHRERLVQEGFDIPYAYRVRDPRGLAHAFVNTLLFLDYGRQGFPYPVVPFHVNCYGSSLLRSRGGAVAPGEEGGEPDPPAPSPKRCFEAGRATARILRASPWRVSLIGSSSWSHAFLTSKNGWIFPDMEADRRLLEQLKSGRYVEWGNLNLAELEAAGQHEILNWMCLAGAMAELGRAARIVDYVESWVFNSNKCFAVFPP